MKILWVLALVSSSVVHGFDPKKPQAPGCAKIVASAKTTASGELSPWRIPAVFAQANPVNIKPEDLGPDAGNTIAMVIPQSEEVPETLPATVAVPDSDEVARNTTAEKYLNLETGWLRKRSMSAPVKAENIWDASSSGQSMLALCKDGETFCLIDWDRKTVKQIDSQFKPWSRWNGSGKMPYTVGSVFSLFPGQFLVYAAGPRGERTSVTLNDAGQRHPLSNSFQSYLLSHAVTYVRNGNQPYFYAYPEGTQYLELLSVHTESTKSYPLGMLIKPDGSTSLTKFLKLNWSRSCLVHAPRREVVHLLNADFSNIATIDLETRNVWLRETGFAEGSEVRKAGQSPDGEWIYGARRNLLSSSADILVLNTVDLAKNRQVAISVGSRINQILVIENGTLALVATENNGIVLYDLIGERVLTEHLWNSPPNVHEIRRTENQNILYWGPVPKWDKEHPGIPETYFVEISFLDKPVPPPELSKLAVAQPLGLEYKLPVVKDPSAELHRETMAISQEFSRLEMLIRDPEMWKRFDAPHSPILENLRLALETIRSGGAELWSLRQRNLVLRAALQSELAQTLERQTAELHELDKLAPQEPRTIELTLTTKMRFNTVTSLQQNLKQTESLATAIDVLVPGTSTSTRTLENLQHVFSNELESPDARTAQIRKALAEIAEQIGKSEK